MKISLFLMVFIITTFLFSASATDYTIDGDNVFIDDSNIYLSAYPHTLTESGYVYFNLTSKQYSGDIDFCFGFNSLQCKPISAEILVGNDWIDISHRFNSIDYDYDKLNKWHYLKEIPIYSNTNYTLRAYLQINEISTGGKYGVAIKPSSETISQAINNNRFYYLDPWWNGSWLYRKTITLTGNTSGAQTNYQLLLNVTYESYMQSDFKDLRFTNDTHQVDAWLESKVDSTYALIWVEFPTTPASGVDQNYYMYYGNVDAMSDWNFDSTFIFGDLFNNATLDTGRWISVDGNPTYSIDATNHYLEITNMDENNWENGKGFHSKTISLPSEWIIEDAYSSDGFGMYHHSTIITDIFNSIFSVHHSTWSSSDYGIGFFKISDDISNQYSVIKEAGVGGNVDYDSGITTPSLPITHDIKMWKTGGNIHITEDTTERVNETNSEIPDRIHLGIGHFETWGFGTKRFYAFKVRKYATNPPTYAFGAEEKFLYIPPNPTNLQNTTGDFWINHTWQPGAGNITDSYNVSVNNVWHNGTINTCWNTTYEYGNNSWQNIIIWAYNNTNMGSLSTNSISQNTQLLFTNLPTNLQKTHNHTWINWTWSESFIGTHIIDSYNVSINGTWYNSTTNQSYNHTGLNYWLTSSIIICGYNNTQGLSVYCISESYTFLTKYKIVEALKELVTPIQIIADKFFNIIPFIISIILFAGFGLAIMVMTSRLKKW